MPSQTVRIALKYALCETAGAAGRVADMANRAAFVVPDGAAVSRGCLRGDGAVLADQCERLAHLGVPTMSRFTAIARVVASASAR